MVHPKMRVVVASVIGVSGFALFIWGRTTHGNSHWTSLVGMLLGMGGWMVPFLFWPFREYCPMCKGPTTLYLLPPSGTFDVLKCDDEKGCGWHD